MEINTKQTGTIPDAYSSIAAKFIKINGKQYPVLAETSSHLLMERGEYGKIMRGRWSDETSLLRDAALTADVLSDTKYYKRIYPGYRHSTEVVVVDAKQIAPLTIIEREEA